MSASRVVLGIDPGYDRCGWACLEKVNQTLRVVGSGCIQTSANSSLARRYRSLQEQLEPILTRFSPTECGIETLFFARNVTTALKVSEARGVVLALLAKHNIEIFEYAPSQIKSAVTGSGRATKNQVLQMIRVLTKHEVSPKLDDEADAIAAGMCHLLCHRVLRTVTP